MSNDDLKESATSVTEDSDSHVEDVLCVRCGALHNDFEFKNWFLYDNRSLLGISSWYDAPKEKITNEAPKAENQPYLGDVLSKSQPLKEVTACPSSSCFMSKNAPLRVAFASYSKKPYFIVDFAGPASRKSSAAIGKSASGDGKEKNERLNPKERIEFAERLKKLHGKEYKGHIVHISAALSGATVETISAKEQEVKKTKGHKDDSQVLKRKRDANSSQNSDKGGKLIPRVLLRRKD